MKLTPYSTTVGQMYRIKETISKVKLAFIRRELEDLGNGLYGITAISDDCPVFSQPLTVLETEMQDKVVVDIRPFTSIDRRTNELIVRNKEALKVMNFRARVLALWDMTGAGNDDLMALGTLPIKAFSKYMAGNIARQRQLDAIDTHNLEIITAFYYYCLFKERSTFKELDKARAINNISRMFYKQAHEIEELLDGVDYIEDIQDYANVVKSRIESPTINVITPALIYSFLGGGWFGPNAREHVLVSLEHPPTWIWLVYEAVSNKLYKQTMLGKLTQQLDQKGAGNEFVRSVDFLVR